MVFKHVLYALSLGALMHNSANARQALTAAAAPTASILADIDQQIRNKEAEGFGGVLIVTQGKRELIARGYGYANREEKISFTPTTLAPLASLTKSQTGAAIASLVANGRLSLDDAVSKFVPEAPEPGRSRTIRQLLTHTSGLMDACTVDLVPQSERLMVHDCLAQPLVYPVGEDNYSNLGYSVLALVIQRVTGMQWEAALKQLVWDPMGMHGIASTFPRRSPPVKTRGYLRGVPQPVLSQAIRKLNGNDWALRGNGALTSSGPTMLQFLDALIDGGTRYPEHARQLMLKPVAGQQGRVQEGFGLVFRYDEAGRLTRVGHSGSDGVFYTYFGWLPQNDIRIYFVGNAGSDQAEALISKAIGSLMKLPSRNAVR